MDTPSLPIASLLAAQSSTLLPASARRAETVASQTVSEAAPVDPTQLPAPIKGLGILPLDLYLVGDNDDVPPPTERDRAVDVIGSEAQMSGVATTGDRDPDAPADLPVAVAPAAEQSSPLARAVQVLDGPEDAPNIDIRR